MTLDEVLHKHGFDPLKIRCGAGCGDGWVPLIDDLISDLKDAGWVFEIDQIKEKFGGLRFYIGEARNATSPDHLIHDRIHAAEAQSMKTCEVCGEPGQCGGHGTGWMLTLCHKHGVERAAKARALGFGR